jgi:hypothetical protein
MQNHEQRLTGGEVVVYCACPNEATAVKVAQKLSWFPCLQPRYLYQCRPPRLFERLARQLRCGRICFIESSDGTAGSTSRGRSPLTSTLPSPGTRPIPNAWCRRAEILWRWPWDLNL